MKFKQKSWLFCSLLVASLSLGLFSNLALADTTTSSSQQPVTKLTIYTYLKPNQQQAVLGYLARHHLQEADVIHFYYIYHPYAIFANTMAGDKSVNKGQGYLIGGKYWQSTEHYFQAMKFPGNPTYQDTIRQAKSGADAAKLGKANQPGKDPRWDQNKKQVMFTALTAKFTQDKAAQDTLLSTGDKILIEAAAGTTNFQPDFTWGIGDDGSGLNWLGELLMQVRQDLQ